MPVDVEQLVADLKKAVRFKPTTMPGDVLLMVQETDSTDQPIQVAYAMAREFVRDRTKKDEWWHVHLTFLTLPPTPTVLILQEAHFTGREVFTIGGKKVFIQAVDFEIPAEPDPAVDPSETKRKGGLRVVKG